MKTYNVKQIADMLGTNPETVRRWIRDNKIKAIQTSRKDGNIITEDELERFIKMTPKYLSKIAESARISVLSPIAGIGALAGGIVASALLGYFETKKSVDTRIRLEDFKEYLSRNIVKLNETIIQKQTLISQTESEITEITKKIEQYSYLLENEEMLIETLEKATNAKEEDN